MGCEPLTKGRKLSLLRSSRTFIIILAARLLFRVILITIYFYLQLDYLCACSKRGNQHGVDLSIHILLIPCMYAKHFYVFNYSYTWKFLWVSFISKK